MAGLENVGGEPKLCTAYPVAFTRLNRIHAIVRHRVTELVHAYSLVKAVLNAISREFRPIAHSRTSPLSIQERAVPLCVVSATKRLPQL